VWIEVLRGRGHERFRALTTGEEIETCLPVIQEVLQGFDNDRAFEIATVTLATCRLLEPTMARDLYDEAIALYRRGRRAGITIRSSVDCLIAVCAVRNSVSILHKDRDFDALGKIIPISAIRF
jgi:predicted nucleic acid-binding protein